VRTLALISREMSSGAFEPGHRVAVVPPPGNWVNLPRLSIYGDVITIDYRATGREKSRQKWNKDRLCVDEEALPPRCIEAFYYRVSIEWRNKERGCDRGGAGRKGGIGRRGWRGGEGR